MKRRRIEENKVIKLTHWELAELEKHAISSYWNHCLRIRSIGQLMQPSSGLTEIDARQRKVILNNINGQIAEARFSYMDGRFRCHWLK